MEYPMNQIVVCKRCKGLEYYGEMRWLSGLCECRNCYKSHYEETYGELYKYDDLNGPRPTVHELSEQEGCNIFKNKYTRILYAEVEKVSDTESRYRNLEDNYTYIIPNVDMDECES